MYYTFYTTQIRNIEMLDKYIDICYNVHMQIQVTSNPYKQIHIIVSGKGHGIHAL